MRTNLVLAALVLYGCDHAAGPASDPSSDPAVIGAWKETLPANIRYFAGSSMIFEFERDSVTISETRFTDVTDCIIKETVTTCTDATWENAYRGKYTAIGKQLDIDLVFIRTTANAVTNPERLEDGKLRFHYGFAGANPQTLILAPDTTAAVAFAGKDTLTMTKAIR